MLGRVEGYPLVKTPNFGAGAKRESGAAENNRFEKKRMVRQANLGIQLSGFVCPPRSEVVTANQPQWGSKDQG